MKRLLISGCVVVALLAVATTLSSRSSYLDDRSATTDLSSAKNSLATVDVSKLPVDEFEDMSLVFSTPKNL